VVRNGPDLARLRPVTPEPALKRGRRYLLAYIGAMEVQDGIEYALYALHDLVHRRGRCDVSLVLMGDGAHAPALRALAHDLGLDGHVHFTGWVETHDIVRYLSVADVGLTPDPRNGLNEYSTMEKTMEYMALGMPGVAFDLPETRLTAQDAALYATPNDAVDFAAKIETLLDDAALRRRLGARGRTIVEDALAWDYNRRRLVEAYERLFSPAVSPPVSDANLPARRNLAWLRRKYERWILLSSPSGPKVCTTLGAGSGPSSHGSACPTHGHDVPYIALWTLWARTMRRRRSSSPQSCCGVTLCCLRRWHAVVLRSASMATSTTTIVS
jgi:hypothetical protein